MLKKIGMATGMLLVAGTLASAALGAIDRNVIPYGITVNGISLGGKTKAEAEMLITPAYAAYENTPLTFKKREKEVMATPRELGIAFPVRDTLARAYALGKDRSPLRNLVQKIQLLFQGKDFAIKASLDDGVFTAYLKKYLAPLEQKARSASLIYSQDLGVFQVVEEKTGLIINQSKLRYDLLKEAQNLSRDIITLQLRQDTPTITMAMLADAQTQANALLNGKPFVLTYRDPRSATTTKDALSRSYQIEKSQLKDMLLFFHEGNTVRIRANDEAIKNALTQIAPSLNEEPQNAALTFKKGKVDAFSLAQEGITLDVEKSAENIAASITLNSHTADITVSVTLPEIRNETLTELGLTTLLGTGESNFAGSPASRMFNLKLGAKKLNGILIKPGEEFSVVNALGDISEKSGFQAALVIKDRKTVPEYGGGLCQVSTTLFRSVIYAGLKVTERFPHSLPVQYYNPQGFDAAIYGPHPDLRFVNDTPSNILIQAHTKGTKLFFELYGTSDGREVKLIGPIERDKKPDGSLKTTLTREIYKENQLIATNVFKSSYGSPHKDIIVKNPLE